MERQESCIMIPHHAGEPLMVGWRCHTDSNGQCGSRQTKVGHMHKILLTHTHTHTHTAHTASPNVFSY
jgi:hypothetical protein